MPTFTALRSLARTPVFTVTVILSLVLGVASVGSMFAIVYGVLFAPLPYDEPERLVSVSLQTPELRRLGQPPAVYQTYQQFAQRLSQVGLYRAGSANIWTPGDGEAAEHTAASWVTASIMPLLQVSPLRGRFFTPDEERQDGPHAVILSESEWRIRFDAADDAIGKTLVVNSIPRQIVGVMPARFAFPVPDTRVWLPVRSSTGAAVADFIHAGIARLAPGATVEQAQRELAEILPEMAALFPRLKSGGATATWLDDVKPTPIVRPLRDEITGDVARPLWLLAAAAGLVLLVAWANVANLMLIRADARQPELAIRAALGASRLRIASHFLGESLLLGASAAALALLATYVAVRMLVLLGPADVPRLPELGVGPMTVVFITLVTVAGVIVCAAVPAFRRRRASLSAKLGDGARGQSSGRARQRLRAGIVVLQIAVALVVSLGSALLLRTAHNLDAVHRGFDASNVTVIWTLLPFARYDDAAAVAFHDRLADRVRQIPSVRAAGLTMRVPLGAGEPMQRDFRIEGQSRVQSLAVTVVDEGYFAAMKIPLLAGRGFGRLEAQRSTDLIISQRAATSVFGDASGATALGKRLSLATSGPRYTVIGVVGDVRDQDLASAPTAAIYRPPVVATDRSVEPGTRRAMALVVSSSEAPDSVVASVRRIVRELDPTIPIFNVEPMSDVVRASTARLSLALALITVAAVIALLLGTIGLYGVMAYMIALRRHEFGVRVALGASPGRIAGWVALRGLMLTASGVAAGLILYLFAAPFLRAYLFGVTATDPATLLVTVLALASAGTLASWLPARRAARIDPAEVLRAE